MDVLPRVKPKQNYEWFQDQKTVRVRLQIKGTSSKKIDIFISDLILKVNVQEKNFVKIFDLQHEIDFQTKENNVVYSNDILEITLKKQRDQEWTDFIVQDMDKESIKLRREESFKVKEDYDRQFSKQLGDLKIKYDSHATREQMKQEDDMRNELDKRKKSEKEKAEQDIYTDGKEESVQTKIMHTYKDNEIFSNKDLQNYENQIAEVEERIPKVRNNKKLDIQFTEKIYPMVSTREQHFKDAPMPKMKNNKGEKAGEDFENKNPLWLKDKGDEFFKNKDFYSAQNAYSQAYKLDKTLIICIANRSALHICLFNYEECIYDCDIVLNFAQEGEERKTKYRDLIIKCKLRKAIALSWKGLVEESIILFTKILAEDTLEENERTQIQEALNIAQSRNESIRQKKIGDNEYKNANFMKALTYYQKSVDLDGNETSLGNISVTYLKLNQNQECIEACNTCIQKVTQFIRYSNFNPTFKQSSSESNNFLIKLYLRKSKALQNIAQNTEAFDTIKLALQIDETNKEARQISNLIEKALNKEKVIKLKLDAANFMKNKQVSNALEIYNECLNILDQSETLEFLALLLNRCACYMHLQQFDDIISSSLRGLKIIRSFKNRVISWDNQKLSKEDKQKLNDFEVRFLIRRANAYLQQNQIYNAKNDMQEALKLDPTNEGIKQDLEKINQSVN